ncbi:MarR family winged helix-turn-helix transcriptional regulator [Amycolatopsis aidingensis]|uniref:MarR family winged helix-turn-helix transcriptional regulator n=1 Tax=Amycolatopsis aidingensis TaxID=2842453 RepID=UPI001E5651B9|nr:MarR family winged helix-turn-helix transcriptional regulator [Amycolatopsis aidingensis]
MGELPVQLAVAFRAVMDRVHTRLATEGFADVRPAHGFVFQFLSFRDGATAVELAEHLGVTKQAAVQLVDELVRNGYVTRGPHPTDRRSRLVSLTTRGWACIGRVLELWQEIEREWEQRIGAPRLAQLRADLTALTEHTADGHAVPLRPLW